eukprot:6204573-Pleurochrysis_carterae.AAC.1
MGFGHVKFVLQAQNLYRTEAEVPSGLIESVVGFALESRLLDYIDEPTVQNSASLPWPPCPEHPLPLTPSADRINSSEKST